MTEKTERVFPHGGAFGHHGISLRDYFAAQALVGFLSGKAMPEKAEQWAEILSGWSYEAADAMLTTRDQSTPDQRGEK